MLENHLSPWGRRLAIAIMVLGGTYAIYAAIGATGPARPIIAWQIRHLGGYAPKVTGAILIAPVVLGGYAFGFLFDLATRQGAFARPGGDPFDPATFGQVRKVKII